MALEMDVGAKQEGKFIKAVEVEFKPKSGEFVSWDGTDNVTQTEFEGIVVGTGFQFRGNIGNPTKKKSVNYLSEDFDMETLKNGQISVREFIRDNGSSTNKPMGKKTYEQWKADGLKVSRVVFAVKPDDMEKVYKLCFSAVASIPVGKAMDADIPNFVTEFAVADEMFETDNGEFYVPKVTKKTPIGAELEGSVGEWLKKVKAALSKKAPLEMKKEEGVSREDIPF